MKCVFVNRGDINSQNLEKELIKELTDSNFEINDDNPDIVISLGGDGTFLRAVTQYFDVDPLFININTGNFGYLCEFQKDEYEEVVKLIKGNKKKIKTISLLEADFEKEKRYALNEFRIHSSDEKTISFDVYIDGTFLEKLRGDGCVIASSIGSSGVAKSLGGALVDNEIEMIEFVENAPISNRGYASIRSPFVLSRTKKITLKNFFSNFNLYYDIHAYKIEKDIKEITFSLSDKKIRILKNKNKNYIKKTSEAFSR